MVVTRSTVKADNATPLGSPSKSPAKGTAKSSRGKAKVKFPVKTPAKKAAAPAKKAASPAKKAASSAKRAASPVKKATPPAKKVRVVTPKEPSKTPPSSGKGKGKQPARNETPPPDARPTHGARSARDESPEIIRNQPPIAPFPTRDIPPAAGRRRSSRRRESTPVGLGITFTSPQSGTETFYTPPSRTREERERQRERERALARETYEAGVDFVRCLRTGRPATSPTMGMGATRTPELRDRHLSPGIRSGPRVRHGTPTAGRLRRRSAVATRDDPYRTRGDRRAEIEARRRAHEGTPVSPVASPLRDEIPNAGFGPGGMLAASMRDLQARREIERAAAPRGYSPTSPFLRERAAVPRNFSPTSPGMPGRGGGGPFEAMLRAAGNGPTNGEELGAPSEGNLFAPGPPAPYSPILAPAERNPFAPPPPGPRHMELTRGPPVPSDSHALLPRPTRSHLRTPPGRNPRTSASFSILRGQRSPLTPRQFDRALRRLQARLVTDPVQLAVIRSTRRLRARENAARSARAERRSAERERRIREQEEEEERRRTD